MGHADGTPADPLDAALAKAAQILPDQGPIGVFVHHNTLHAFQHLPFHEGVQAGARWLGALPYPEIGFFRDALRAGRIEDRDLEDELDAACEDSPIAPGLTRRTLWRALLRDTPVGDEAGIAWRARHGQLDADPGMLAEALARAPRSQPAARPARHRDALIQAGGEDTDVAVHAELIRLASGYLDQGQARDALPQRERGFLPAVAALFAAAPRDPASIPGVSEDLRAIAAQGKPPRRVLEESLAALGVTPRTEGFAELVIATALALPGWTGMFARLERRPDEQADDVQPTLLELLAVRLVFERRAIEAVAAGLGLPTDWCTLVARPRAATSTPTADAAVLATVARAAGWSTLPPDEVLSKVWEEIDAFTAERRRALWLEAYERRYRRQILDAIAARRAGAATGDPKAPRVQFAFCIDEREESIRRAIEEQGPDYETLGVAGFFGVAIDYRGLDDHHHAPHCPAVVVPAHEITERHESDHAEVHDRRQTWREAQHTLERRVADAALTLPGAAVISVIGGPILAAVTAGRVIAPSLSLTWAERFRSWHPRPLTRLAALRQPHEAPNDSGLHRGFTHEEAADRVRALLQNLGIADRLAPLVIVLGHGSTSLNNPHESAHDCGACGGRRGGANARLIAQLANQAEVRAILAARGAPIPEGVWFLGGLHDTANDAVELYDLDVLPPTHQAVFAEAERVLDRARAESAAERCRRFDDVPLGATPEVAMQHVGDRTSHLGQPRPEYGHCTNAVCVVGRRAITRGLHLDRRAFLVSYDPSVDPTSAILERILAAVGPVGAGISLEYYFSSVDNEVFGCGTKLPHNVTGLIGVMAGHRGDLRTGLPIQMVELHEPMRLLLIVEATPEVLLGIAGRQAEVRELVVNRWVQLISVDPVSGALHEFTAKGFVPYTPDPTPLPVVTRSAERHTTRAHLPPAIVTAGLESPWTP